MTGADGRLFWRIVDERGAIVTFSSARYSTAEDCRAAIEALRAQAADSSIIDLTVGEESPPTRAGERSQ